MSTSGDSTNKSSTRNSGRRIPDRVRRTLDSQGASPVLSTGRKRNNSLESQQGEPLPKRMAKNQILEAINGVQKSVAKMEGQLQSVPTKSDFSALVNEIKSVRESVIRNTDRIDTLFDLQKNDQPFLAKRVEKLVKINTEKLPALSQQAGKLDAEHEAQFLSLIHI